MLEGFRVPPDPRRKSKLTCIKIQQNSKVDVQVVLTNDKVFREEIITPKSKKKPQTEKLPIILLLIIFSYLLRTLTTREKRS